MWETPGVHAVKIARSAVEVLSDHTALELECPSLPERLSSSDRSGSVALFPPGATLCRPLMTPMTRCFVKDLERFAQQHEIVQAQRTQRTKEYLSRWQGGEGILYQAQERARVLRTERRSCHGYPVPLVNEQYGNGESYFRRKFRPTIPEVLFLLPMPSSVGHDYLKMQKRGIAALDNGILRCDDP